MELMNQNNNMLSSDWLHISYANKQEACTVGFAVQVWLKKKKNEG